MVSKQDLKKAAAYRGEIHEEALLRVRAVCPEAKEVVDKYPAGSYFREVWDYPGRWYTVVGTPPGTGGRRDLVCSIVRDTLLSLRDTGAEFSDGEFRRLIAEYPKTACEYRILGAAGSGEAGAHRLALSHIAKEAGFDISRYRCRKLSAKAIFAPANTDSWLNYRRAFLSGSGYADSDFDRVNAALFPCGTVGLEAFRWAESFERCDRLCLTVYDSTLDRFVIITA